jgi:uncharacterized protein (DUF433 family)
MAATGTSYEARLRHERELIDLWIMPHPGKSGYAEAVIVDNGCSVWFIISQWIAYDGDASYIMEAYGLSEEMLKATLAFYRHHKYVIDARMALEEDDWDDER